MRYATFLLLIPLACTPVLAQNRAVIMSDGAIINGVPPGISDAVIADKYETRRAEMQLDRLAQILSLRNGLTDPAEILRLAKLALGMDVKPAQVIGTVAPQKKSRTMQLLDSLAKGMSGFGSNSRHSGSRQFLLIEPGKPATQVTVPDQSLYSLPPERSIVYIDGKPTHVKEIE